MMTSIGSRTVDTGTRRRYMLHLKGCCEHCGSTLRLEVDHIIPTGLGGPDVPENWQLLCHDCHKAKKDVSVVKKALYSDPEYRATVLAKFYAAFGEDGFKARGKKISEGQRRRWAQMSPERKSEITRKIRHAGTMSRKCSEGCTCRRHESKGRPIGSKDSYPRSRRKTSLTAF